MTPHQEIEAWVKRSKRGEDPGLLSDEAADLMKRMLDYMKGSSAWVKDPVFYLGRVNDNG